ncbi:MAG: ABC transporter permease subunit [Acidimicrobiales bacterium]
MTPADGPATPLDTTESPLTGSTRPHSEPDTAEHNASSDNAHEQDSPDSADSQGGPAATGGDRGHDDHGDVAPQLPPAPNPIWPQAAPRPAGAKRVAAGVLLFFVVVSLPLWVGGAGAAFLIDLAVVVTLAQWWGMLAGFAGVPSLAAGLHAGIGAYAWLALVEILGLNPVIALAIAALATAVAALPSGWLLLRLAPRWGALGGLVLAAAMAQVVLVLDDQGAGGRAVQPVSELGATLRRNLTTWLAVVIGVGSVLAVVMLRRSRPGLAVVAGRDDPEAAATLGVRYLWERLGLWCAAGAAIGACGALVHLRSASVSVEEAFDPVRWVLPGLVAATLGGMRTLSGPVLGAVLYVVAERIVGLPAALLVCSVAAAVLLVVLPRGLAEHVTPWLRRQWRAVWSRVGPLMDRSGSSTTPADPH